MRLLALRTAHFFQQIFFQHRGGVGRKRGEAQRDDMRRQVMGAKNIAQKLARGLPGRGAGDEPVILGGAAKIARGVIESKVDMLDARSLPSPPMRSCYHSQ